MSDILLDYVFEVDIIEPLPSADVTILRSVAVVVKAKEGITDTFVSIANSGQISNYTNNTDIVQLFNAGMSKVYLVLWDGDDVSDLVGILDSAKDKFLTLLVSSDYGEANYGNIYEAIKSYNFVLGKSFISEANAKIYAMKTRHSGFLTIESNKDANMFYSFGKLLSALEWNNQQYIECPNNDLITDLNVAKNYRDDRLSFVLTSATYQNRLAFFVAGGQAIAGPYIIENLKIDLQASALKYITTNRPDYTITQAVLLQDEVQKVIDGYIEQGLLSGGSVQIKLVNENFVANGKVSVPRPMALWGVKVELEQS
ncbi:MAG: hypothetical protein LBF97_07870 [Elusimicrobiota bacterium]|jgi:hypothetical protein|nr:hypothetical protein [Elusimicrobiota bacterium]